MFPDAEPKYLIVVRPASPPSQKKSCSGKARSRKPLQLVVGTLTPSSVFLSWGFLINPHHDWTLPSHCPNDRFYTIRYREKDKEKKWVFQLCPATETIVENLKPNTVYEFGVKDNIEGGIWSNIFNHKTIVGSKNKVNGKIQSTSDQVHSVPAYVPRKIIPVTIIKQVIQNVTHRASTKSPDKIPYGGTILAPKRLPEFPKAKTPFPFEKPEGTLGKNSTFCLLLKCRKELVIHVPDLKPQQALKYLRANWLNGTLVLVLKVQGVKQPPKPPGSGRNETAFDTVHSTKKTGTRRPPLPPRPTPPRRKPLPPNNVTGKPGSAGPHVRYIPKPENSPCSITDSVKRFPKEEATEANITSPPQNPPTNLTVVTVEGCPSFVILDWEKPLNDTVTEYEVISRENGSFSGKNKSIQITNQTFSTVENLKPDTSYEFQVKPKNPLGEGPASNTVSFSTESAGRDAIWTERPFNSDSYSECKGKQYVKRTWYKKFVGVQLCNSLRYKIYLSDSLTGKFYNIGDQRGHGEDHCQFVDSFLDGRTGQQLASDQLPTKE
ncbi:Target of Nesh-SH3, partial [Galemys pyrenaicus]